MKSSPYFGIVIPAYNREREIGRAIDSCLTQDFSDYEILVVDDGSTDGTAATAAARLDSRIRVIRHAANRGVCPARNTGVRVSTGRWIVFLDSDHEMLPSCLSRIFEVTSSSASSIDRFGFMYDFDDGRVSPSPLPQDRVLGYLDWLRWMESVEFSDALWVTRRRCFDKCIMPESYALEFSYHLEFSKTFTSRVIAETVACQHTDSQNRLSLSGPPDSRAKIRRRALDQVADWEDVLLEHGTALKEFSPAQYQHVLRRLAISHVLAGDKLQGTLAGARCVGLNPKSLKNWGALMLACAGPRLTRRAAKAWAQRGEGVPRREATTSHSIIARPQKCQ